VRSRGVTGIAAESAGRWFVTIAVILLARVVHQKPENRGSISPVTAEETVHMGVFGTLRRRRLEKKAAFKAAKVQARETARATAKQDRAREKYLRRTAGKIRTLEARSAKRQDRRDLETAKALVARAKSRTVTPGKILGWVGAARVLVPVAAPLAYRALTTLVQRSGSNGAGPLSGATTDGLGAAGTDPTGPGAVQRARIADLRNRIGARNVPDAVRKKISAKLSSLESTLDSVYARETGNDAQKTADAVTTELDQLDRQLAEVDRG